MPDITPSKTYLHNLRILQTELQEKRITDEEYSKRRDALIEQEARSHKSLGPLLVKQELANVEKGIELKVKEEREQERQALEAEERAKRLEERRQAFNKTISAIQGQEMLQEVEFWNPKKEEKKEERPAQTTSQEDKESHEPTQKPEEPDQEEETTR